jgi:hypothetical protein
MAFALPAKPRAEREAAMHLRAVCIRKFCGECANLLRMKLLDEIQRLPPPRNSRRE